MIQARFKLYSPWRDDVYDGWDSIWDRTWSLTTYKNLELGFYRAPGQWLNLGVSYYTKRCYDHPGATIELGIFGYEFQIVFYDSRHRDIKWEEGG